MNQTEKSCHICNSDLISYTTYLNKFNYGHFNSKQIFICSNCGFGEMQPKIDHELLSNFYENIYRSKDTETYIDFNSTELSMNSFDYRSMSQLLLGTQFLNNKQKYRFLDIGAGRGASFISARKILNNASLYAIEANSDAKNYYSKLLSDISIYENINDIKDKIDILLMSHSLEHYDAHNLQSLFQNIFEVLEKDGIAIIEVPHDDFRNLNNLKRSNDVPHLSFFSLESLSRLINDSGFELCFINTVGPLKTTVQSKDTGIEIVNENKIVKDLIKKAIRYVGLYNYLYKINVFLKNQNFYDNVNFKYGGDRELLRCVFKKK